MGELEPTTCGLMSHTQRRSRQLCPEHNWNCYWKGFSFKKNTQSEPLLDKSMNVIFVFTPSLLKIVPIGHFYLHSLFPREIIACSWWPNKIFGIPVNVETSFSKCLPWTYLYKPRNPSQHNCRTRIYKGPQEFKKDFETNILNPNL